MNYEQKYKEALSRARKELRVCGSQNCDAARQIFRFFPELKESEDERIKREILELVSIAGNGNQFEKIKDWLEKQGEQTQLDYEHTDIPQKDFAPTESKFKNKLDAADVIDWIKTHGNYWTVVTKEINKVIAKFKEDFEL